MLIVFLVRIDNGCYFDYIGNMYCYGYYVYNFLEGVLI
jgi:hypothetical protein